ncbi:universal stress protein [bacterium]|nr:universal stress protein [bacterium]
MFDHILLPLDGSTLAEGVLPHAVALAQAFHSRLTLLRVVFVKGNNDQQSMVNPMDWQMQKSEAESYLKTIQDRLADVDVESEIRVVEGNPAQEIIDYARDESVELIVLSSHGRGGLSEWNINSVVQKVLYRAFVPVMIVRAYKAAADELTGLTYDRIMLPLDGSKRAECSLPIAKSIGSAQGAKVLLTHVVEEPVLPRQTPLNEEDRKLIRRLTQLNVDEAERYFDSVEDQFDVSELETIIETSPKSTAALHDIVDREKIDLVILCAHGYSGENRWPYGNITLNFIAFGTTPLIIIQDLTEDEIAKSLAEKYAEQSKGH